MEPYKTVDEVNKDKDFVKIRDKTGGMHNNAESYAYVLWLVVRTNHPFTEFISSGNLEAYAPMLVSAAASSTCTDERWRMVITKWYVIKYQFPIP